MNQSYADGQNLKNCRLVLVLLDALFEACSRMSFVSMFRRRTFKPKNLDEEIRLIEEIIKARRREGENPNNSENDCPDGEHCERFERIKEGELLTYLRNGWQIVHRPAKDEVIVKR
ncbi:MAG: hypothetical protein JSV29_02030 [Candidatus Bathyarchaeota archaeon]|nr:MAG: hypothetical protein JSV29_02030 [Candidatus Bathyarchaeota archaeon]